jgi:hypothetical protein
VGSRCDAPGRQCYTEHVFPRLDSPKPKDDYSTRARCPCHADTDPSLSVSVGRNDRVVWQCFAGCNPLAIRAALIRSGVPPGCLIVARPVQDDVVTQIIKLYEAGLSHAELRWRVWSVLSGYEGKLPPKRRYVGGRRKFAADAGVGRTELYAPDPGFNS